MLVIFAIRYVSDTATGLTDLALVAVPILAAVALGWAMRGAKPLAALAAIPLFVLAWRSQNTLAGEAAGTLLSALSCVTLGVLLSAVTPARWLKAGIVLMAAADVWLVATDLLQSPNNVLVAAQPPAGLPAAPGRGLRNACRWVTATCSSPRCSERCWRHQWRRQWHAAVLTLVIAGCFDLLFFFINELPATVPVALALLVTESWQWWRQRQLSAARRRPSMRADAIPRQAR